MLTKHFTGMVTRMPSILLSSTETSHKIGHRFFSNSSSLASQWTPKQLEAVELFKNLTSESMIAGNPGLLALDFDGTTAHTKEAIHLSKKSTYTKITGESSTFCENTAIHMVDGVPEQMFKKHYGEKWSYAYETFEQEMDVHYPEKARFMPGMPEFLEAVSILKDAGLMKTAIVSYMTHGRLNEAAANLDLWNVMDAVEGTQNAGNDKTTPEMFTERVYPKVFGKEEPSGVICIGDSRYTDRLTAESVPNGKGAFIAYGKGKCGSPLKEETEYPHIPDWYAGTDMLVMAAKQAIKEFSGHNRLMTQEKTSYVMKRLDELANESGQGCSRAA